MARLSELKLKIRTVFPTRAVCDELHGSGEEGSALADASNHLEKRVADDGTTTTYWVGDRKVVWLDEVKALEWEGRENQQNPALIGAPAARKYLDANYYMIAGLDESKVLSRRRLTWCTKKGAADEVHWTERRDFLTQTLEILKNERKNKKENAAASAAHTAATTSTKSPAGSNKRSRVDDATSSTAAATATAAARAARAARTAAARTAAAEKDSFYHRVCDLTWGLIGALDDRMQMDAPAEGSRFKMDEILSLRDLQRSIKLAVAEYGERAPVLQEIRQHVIVKRKKKQQIASARSATSRPSVAPTASEEALAASRAALTASAAIAAATAFRASIAAAVASISGTGEQHANIVTPPTLPPLPPPLPFAATSELPEDIALGPVTEASETSQHLFKGFAELVKDFMGRSLVSQTTRITSEMYDRLVDVGRAGGIEKNVIVRALGTKAGFDIVQSPGGKLIKINAVVAKQMKILQNNGVVEPLERLEPVARCCSVCERSGLELRQVDRRWKSLRSPLFCAHCVAKLEVDGNVICTRRGCVCSYKTGTTICKSHRDPAAPLVSFVDGKSLFEKKNDIGETTGEVFSMCVPCRDHLRGATEQARNECRKRKIDWTDDERNCFPKRFPGYILPVLSIGAIEGVTMCAHELSPPDWCRTYTLLCEWERKDGIFPTAMSKWTDAWWAHHVQFIRHNSSVRARRGSKEAAYPQYLTHRLLGALSKLKAMYEPVFAIPERPTVEEWLTLLSQDKHQLKGLKSEQTRVHVVRCIMRGELSGTSPLLQARVIDLCGHKSLRVPAVKSKLLKAGFDVDKLPVRA